jgi:ABC-2 type transport system permease protein
MALRRTFTLARRVIQQLAADRRTIALILFVPLIVLTVPGLLIRAETTRISIGIVMLDAGTSIPLRGEVNLGEGLSANLETVSDFIHVFMLDSAQAQAMLERGELDAVITVPEDFSAQTVETRELHFPVEFEGSNPMSAQVLQGLLMQSGVRSLAGLSIIGTQTITPPTITLEATYRYGGPDFDSLDYIAPVFVGLFSFMFVFILTSVAFLRERTAGTLERLQATPIRRYEIVVGYMFGFAIFAILQSLITLGYTIWGLQVHYNGSL